MAQILNGRELSAQVREKVKNRIQEQGLDLGLAVILVGADPASHTYVGLKQKACEEVGIRFEKHLYFATEPEEKMIEKINELNKRDDIHGILVQLPLPNQNADKIIAAIDPNKDVDGFHRKNMERLKAREPGLVPAVSLGIMKLIDAADTPSKRALIIGSQLFAEPLITLLSERKIITDIISADDPDLSSKTKTADIIIVAVGKPGLITGEIIKPGAIVIDVGTTKIDDKIVGDVDQVSADQVAGYLTPVPGGVGPMTVAMLLINVLKAFELQK